MMYQVEKWAARVLLLNGALALLVACGLLGPALASGEFAIVLPAALLALVSAVLSLRRHRYGLWGALIYYGLQVFSYYPYSNGWSLSVKAGVSIAAVLHFSQGALAINFVALALLIVTALVLRWRRRADRANAAPQR
jgi:hypothetical protein